ncbi:ETX/MTX2 family pore-forming toxin [Bacillus toyonensis]|uniref:ETX/MTX2 family pore-forming toxin n=1 Tax=Bacillus toyonensis TaxID=155322 RepID=UPI002FFFB0CC
MAILDIWTEVDKFATNYCKVRGLTYSGKRGSVPQYPLILTKFQSSLPDDRVLTPPEHVVTLPKTYDNITSQPQTTTLSFSEEITESSSTTTTAGVTIGTELSSTQTFKIKFVEVGLTQTVSSEYTTTSSKTLTTEHKRVVTSAEHITVQPYTRIKAVLVIENGIYDLITNITCDLNGLIYFDATNGTSFLTTIYEVLKGNNTPGFTFSFEDPEDPTCHFDGSGKIKGNSGLNSYVRVEEHPLEGHSGQYRQYILPGQDLTTDIITSENFGIPIFN